MSKLDDRKPFLAAGDLVINPGLLAYAVVETDTEGPHLRLGFTSPASSTPGEILLSGLEARSVLRWLRTNAEFLDAGSPPSRPSRPISTIAAENGVRASGLNRAVALAISAGH